MRCSARGRIYALVVNVVLHWLQERAVAMRCSAQGRIYALVVNVEHHSQLVRNATVLLNIPWQTFCAGGRCVRVFEMEYFH